MSNLRDLLAKANAGRTIRTYESSIKSETNSFDELEDTISDLAVDSVATNFNTGVSKDGIQLQVGDPVVGTHRGQNLAGQVIAIDGDMVTVEWKNKETSRVRANTLTLSDVDSDYQEQTMYVEAVQPNMGFDKESFNEDADLEDLLKGRVGESASGASFKYGDVDVF